MTGIIAQVLSDEALARKAQVRDNLLRTAPGIGRPRAGAKVRRNQLHGHVSVTSSWRLASGAHVSLAHVMAGDTEVPMTLDSVNVSTRFTPRSAVTPRVRTPSPVVWTYPIGYPGSACFPLLW